MLDELNAAVALIATYLKPLIPKSSQNSSVSETNYVILKSKQPNNDSIELCESSDICNGEETNIPEHSRTSDGDQRELEDECSLESILHQALVSALQAKFEGHWYPLLPSKVSYNFLILELFCQRPQPPPPTSYLFFKHLPYLLHMSLSLYPPPPPPYPYLSCQQHPIPLPTDVHDPVVQYVVLYSPILCKNTCGWTGGEMGRRMRRQGGFCH